MEVVQYIGDNISTVGDSISIVEAARYSGEWLQYCRGERLQYCGGCSVQWGHKINTCGYCRGDNSSTSGGSFGAVEDIFSNVEVVQYSGLITSVQWEIASVLWRVFSTLEKTSVHVGITSVQWAITSVLWRLFSTVGQEFELRHVWSLIMTKRNRHFSKIQAYSMPFESWTDILQIQPCLEIIYNFIFGMLYLSFKFNCLCDCI